MTWRDTAFDAAGIDYTADPSWLLAPLFVRDFFRLRVVTGPGALLDPLPRENNDLESYTRTVRPDRLVHLTAAASDWPAWWDLALDFRPGGPAPRIQDLLSFSPALLDLWPQAESWFDGWLVKRKPTDPAPFVERDRLASFAERNQREPALRSLRVLVLPVSGDLLVRTEDGDRLVVSATLRRSESRYLRQLDAVLADFF